MSFRNSPLFVGTDAPPMVNARCDLRSPLWPNTPRRKNGKLPTALPQVGRGPALMKCDGFPLHPSNWREGAILWVARALIVLGSLRSRRRSGLLVTGGVLMRMMQPLGALSPGENKR